MVVVFWTLCWASEKDGRGGMVQERRGGGFTTIKGMTIETERREADCLGSVSHAVEERSSFKMPEPVKKAGKCAHSPTIEHFVITFHTGAEEHCLYSKLSENPNLLILTLSCCHHASVK